MGAKENPFPWGSGEGLPFCRGLFCSAADLNLGEFIGISFEMVTSQASQAENKSKLVLHFLLDFLSAILAGDTCRLWCVCIELLAIPGPVFFHFVFHN